MRDNFSPPVEVPSSQERTCIGDFVTRRRRNYLLCSP